MQVERELGLVLPAFEMSRHLRFLLQIFLENIHKKSSLMCDLSCGIVFEGDLKYVQVFPGLIKFMPSTYNLCRVL